MRRLPLLALLVAATALLAGCGDDNQDPVLEPTPLSSPPTTATADTGADDAGTGTDATTDTDTDDGDGDGDSGDDTGSDDDTSTTTTEADGDTVTTTSERLDPDDPDYPTAQPSPPVTYPETDG